MTTEVSEHYKNDFFYKTHLIFTLVNLHNKDIFCLKEAPLIIQSHQDIYSEKTQCCWN